MVELGGEGGGGGKKKQNKNIKKVVEKALQATVEGKVIIYCNIVARVKGLVEVGLF